MFVHSLKNKTAINGCPSSMLQHASTWLSCDDREGKGEEEGEREGKFGIIVIPRVIR